MAESSENFSPMEVLRLQDELRRSDERYRSLVQASAQIVWTTAASGEAVTDCPGWRELTGQTLEEFLGWGWTTALHPEDRARVEQTWHHSLTTQCPHETEFRIRTTAGTYRHVMVRGVPVLEPDGKLREWVGVCRDIDARKRMEQNQSVLLTLAQKLNAATVAEDAGQIMAEAAATLFGWDACFIYLCNESQEALFPIINVDTVGGRKIPVRPVYDGTPPSPLAREVMQKGGRLILRKPPFAFEPQANAFGDTQRASASLLFAPIREGEKVFGLLSIQSYTPDAYTNENLTTLQLLADHCGGALRRIRATEELRAAKELLGQQAMELEKRVQERTAELKHTISSLETFCYTIAHDLRAPLRSLQGFTNALAEDYSSHLDPAGQDFCRRIMASARRMDRMIQDLLAYGQLMHQELPLTAVSLDQIVKNSLTVLTEEIKGKQAEVELISPLPDVLGNSLALEQMTANLLGNALKFMPPNTRPRLRIWAEAKAGKIRLCISDNGIGIPREHHERIFRVFERLHGTTAFPGTGVGLAMVRQGAERMRGRAGVESEPDHGSTFWIELSPAEVAGDFSV